MSHLENYADYFRTDWWRSLKIKHIYKNSSANCYICQSRVNLLLHHCSYGALYHEKLYKDIYIVCYDCHQLIHFWLFKLIKVPLRTNWLLFSMRLRRVIFCFKTGRLLLALLWLITTLIVGLFNISIWLIWKTGILIFKLLKLLVDSKSIRFLK